MSDEEYKKEKALAEDTVRKQTAEKKKKKKTVQTRVCALLVYTEGVIDEENESYGTWENWLADFLYNDEKAEYLKDIGVSLCFIMHDKDVYDETTESHVYGEAKKVHYHVIVKFPSASNKLSEKAWGKWFHLPERFCKCLDSEAYHSMLRYLIHEDEVDKFHYSADDVCFVGSCETAEDFEVATEIGSFEGGYITPSRLASLQDFIMERRITTSVQFCKELKTLAGFDSTKSMSLYMQGKRFFDGFFKECDKLIWSGDAQTQMDLEMRSLRRRNQELLAKLQEHGVAFNDTNLDVKQPKQFCYEEKYV